MFFFIPGDVDFAGVEAWISLVNDRSQAIRIERSAPDNISIRVSGLPAGSGTADVVLFYVWARSFDTSGNFSAFDKGDFDGSAVHVRRINAADVVQFSNLITNTAQIANAIITNAHIQNLAAEKILAGNVTVALRIGIGGNTFIDGPNRLFIVLDEIPQTRVQMGRLGPGAQDYGLQIFGADGSLWHSFTGGTQSKGRQDQNQASFGVSINIGDGTTVLTGVFTVSSTTGGFIIRVAAAGSESVAAKGGARRPIYGSQEHSFTYPAGIAGKTMAISPSLTGIVQAGSLVTATLLVHYW
jgi:hypothetical protein